MLLQFLSTARSVLSLVLYHTSAHLIFRLIVN
uniref:Uncharacterized protein n=1 Tax=Arundo donax TaxID=35708 RepID=A0A0A9BJ50_ARUDO